jgi:hypothetical protein
MTGATLFGANSPLPALTTPTGTADAKLATHAANIQKIRDVNLVNQADGGLQAALIGAYSRFYDRAEMLLPLKLIYPIAGHSDVDFGHVGSEMRLPADGGGHHTINALLEIGADYLEGHTGSVLVNAKLSADDSELDVTLFGMED